MFQPTRDEARTFLFETWRKYRAGELLSPLEDLTAQLIEKHPEYHPLLADPANRDQEFVADGSTVNPFLHLMMHLTIEEQLSINQPRGVRAQFQRLTTKYRSEHEAQHAMMTCLGEMLWQAQRTGGAPDASVYLSCLERE
ncbi:MAG: DUF1841 family protein [Sideroxydans sp.]